jgi:hypothetical protein
MVSKSSIVAGCLVALCLLLAVRSFGASQLDSVTIGYSSFSEAYGPLWIAVEDQLGRKHGLDLKAIYDGRVPQVEQTDPAPAIDASTMRRIEQSGFMKTLYKK